jgi:hypothetical protein
MQPRNQHEITVKMHQHMQGHIKPVRRVYIPELMPVDTDFTACSCMYSNSPTQPTPDALRGCGVAIYMGMALQALQLDASGVTVAYYSLPALAVLVSSTGL